MNVRDSPGSSVHVVIPGSRYEWSAHSTALPLGDWDHAEVPVEKAKTLLDGILALRSLKPWAYRQCLGYLLRSQDDYGDVFQLAKQASKHLHWKPFLAHWLGFDAKLVERLYEKEELLEKRKTEIATLNVELGGSVEDVSKAVFASSEPEEDCRGP